MWQVHLSHVKVNTWSPPVCLEAANGALEDHVELAEAVVEVFLPAVQLPCVGLHKQREKGRLGPQR